MPTPRARLGRRAEILAAQELGQRGYRIIDSNFRCRMGEIDLIAKDGDTLVFVEVRSHRSTNFGTPAESVTPAKQRKIITTARVYLAMKNLGDISCRFDVVAVMFEDAGPRVEVIRDAF